MSARRPVAALGIAAPLLLAACAPLHPKLPQGVPQAQAQAQAKITAGAAALASAPAQRPTRPPTAASSDCRPDPYAGRRLHLRGSFNGWADDDDFAFQWVCDHHQLVSRLEGEFQLKLGDADWSADADWGAAALHWPPQQAPLSPKGAAFGARLTGPTLLQLRWQGPQPLLSALPCPAQGGCGQPLPPPAAAAVAHPVAASLRFDSRQLAHRRPFGAVPAGSEVEFEVHAAPGVQKLTLVVERRRLEGDQQRLAYEAGQRIPMQRSALDAHTERWQARHRFAAVAVHGHWFEAEVDGRLYVLHNNRRSLAWTREKGTGGAAVVEALPADHAAIRRFRLPVFEPGFTTPAWAREAVYYYVFPERFRNGDPSNDPQPGSRRYQQWPVEHHERWLGPPFKPGSGDGSDAAYNNDFFGGDLAGLTAKLDHIQALGATALYLTPIFLAASNHKYDTADYHRIDPGFGTLAEFDRLLAEAARHGLRVVLDASLNHTGSDSAYFDRFGNFAEGGASRPLRGALTPAEAAAVGAFSGGRLQPDSPQASWYHFDPSQPEADQRYRGWQGFADLPELDKASPSWRDFAYGAPDSVTRRWLRRGTGGWRMDVAPWVPDDFWREWRRAVKATAPEAVTIAETWFDPSKHLLGDMFDASMNYVWRQALLDFARGGSGAALAAHLEHLREQLPPQALHAMMNLLSGHDVPRTLHAMGDTGADATAAAKARAQQRFRLATTLQFFLPGAPTIYYGDEVGMLGGEDPYNRAPFPWEDEGGRPDLALQAWVTQLAAERRAQPALRRGALLAPLLVADDAVVLARRSDDGRCWALGAFAHRAPGLLRLPPQPPAVAAALAGPPRVASSTVLDAARWSADGSTLALHLPAAGAAWWAGCAGG